MQNYYDLIVIGGGPAGYYSAIRASQIGKTVALIEKNELGGTCLNRGCIPTKTFIKNVDLIDSIKYAEKRGINIADNKISLDLKKSLAYKNAVVKKLVSGVNYLLKTYNVDIFNAEAKITDKNTVMVNDKPIKADKIFLATGSKASDMGIEGADSKLVLDSEQILDIDYIPETLIIVGAGVIGLEMAMIFNSYGSNVTIIELLDRPLANMDKDISAFIKKELEKKGIKFKFSCKIDKFKESGGKIYAYSDDEIFQADLGLISIGRLPDLSAIEDFSLDLDGNKIRVNDYLQTSVEGVYAIGDCNGKKMLAHAAYKMAEIAVENAFIDKDKTNLASKEKLRLNLIPAAVYTHPEIATIGLNEEEARKKYHINIGIFDLGSNGRAMALGHTVGFIKVIVDKKYGEILGVHMVGYGASEIINEAAQLMTNEITVYEAIKTSHTHPSIGEALEEALMDAIDRPIHKVKNK